LGDQCSVPFSAAVVLGDFEQAMYCFCAWLPYPWNILSEDAYRKEYRVQRCYCPGSPMTLQAIRMAQ